MYLDKNQQFSAAQDIGQVAGTYNSTNTVDFGSASYGAAAGGSVMEVLCQIREAVTSAGAGTLQIQLETADETAFDTTNVVLAESPAIDTTSLTANSEHFKIRVPHGCLRYLRLNYIIATATTTAGTIDSWLILDRHTNYMA